MVNTVAQVSGEHLQHLRQQVATFVNEVAIPLEDADIESDIEALDSIANVLRQEAKLRGIYAPQVASEFGGLGLTWKEAAVVFEEAARGMLGPIGLNCAPPDQPTIFMLQTLAQAEQIDRYLLPLVSGEKRACFAMTEPAPGAGSDPNMMRTEAIKTVKGWQINGHKTFISGGVDADFAVVTAKTDQGVTLFIVDVNTPGYKVIRDVGMVTAYQLGGHAEIILESCLLPDEAVLGRVGDGLAHIQLRLEAARLSHCMRFIGRARRALEIAQSYVMDRTSFGKKLADHQLVQGLLADAYIDLHACRLMTQHCAQLMDTGQSIKHYSSMTKVFVSEAVCRVVDSAMQMTGAMGISDDVVINAIWREVRPFRIYDGANEVHRGALAKRILRYQMIP